MKLDPNVQPYISTFIQAQFPRLYEQYGQPFIDFVVAYFKWMETEGPLYDSRRAGSYQDIDTTDVNRFLVYFKDKYLPNIQLETVSNINLLVKHSLDVYRSRGTIQSIDLLFRLVFGVGAKVYYPMDDVFQPSSGRWFIPRYIEVSTQDDLDKYVGREITGSLSGAIAFVDGWVRKKSGSKQIDILYISALTGNFLIGERINTLNTPFNLLDCPTMIGSLTNVDITTGGTGFNIGDIVSLTGSKGYGGQGRVANTAAVTGTVTFRLEDGGYGYTANAQVLVSNSVITLSNVVPPSSNLTQSNYFGLFDTLQQRLANIQYQSAVGGHFANNDSVYMYYANGQISGSGIVLSQVTGASTNGTIFVAVLSGNLASQNTIYKTANAISASIPVSGGFTDLTATGNVIAESLSAVITYNNLTGGAQFVPNETVTNSNTAFGQIGIPLQSGAFGEATISNRVGLWSPNTTIIGATSGAVANLVSFSLGVGVISVNNSFVADSRAPVTGVISGTSGQILELNQGSGASVSVSSTLLYPETVSLNTDLILPKVAKLLNASNWGFAAFATANLATPLATALTFVNYTIGRIATLTAITPGVNYTSPPLIRVYEPVTFPFQKRKNHILYVTGSTGAFNTGDLITQNSSGARGLVLSANSSSVTFEKMSLFNVFVNTVDANSVLSDTASGATANIVSSTGMVYNDPENIGETYIGFNADIKASTVAANGTISSLQVVSSGWGYEADEVISIASANGADASGQVVLLNQGVGSGFYRTENGFVSANKKIHDNDYYQVAAYDVQSAVDFNHYKDMLYALEHVAGTKAFGTFVKQSKADVTLNILPATVSQANSVVNVGSLTGAQANTTAGTPTVAFS